MSNQVKVCRDISLPHTRLLGLGPSHPNQDGACSAKIETLISAMLERRLFLWLAWQFLIGWGIREPRQIVLVQRTLADKARQDVLRSSIVRYCLTSPDLVADFLNSPHTSRKVKIFCRPTKSWLVCVGHQDLLFSLWCFSSYYFQVPLNWKVTMYLAKITQI